MMCFQIFKQKSERKQCFYLWACVFCENAGRWGWAWRGRWTTSPESKSAQRTDTHLQRKHQTPSGSRVYKKKKKRKKAEDGPRVQTVPANKRHTPWPGPSSSVLWTGTGIDGKVNIDTIDGSEPREAAPRQSIFVNCCCPRVVTQYNKRSQWFPEI